MHTTFVPLDQAVFNDSCGEDIKFVYQNDRMKLCGGLSGNSVIIDGHPLHLCGFNSFRCNKQYAWFIDRLDIYRVELSTCKVDRVNNLYDLGGVFSQPIDNKIYILADGSLYCLDENMKYNKLCEGRYTEIVSFGGRVVMVEDYERIVDLKGNVLFTFSTPTEEYSFLPNHFYVHGVLYDTNFKPVNTSFRDINSIWNVEVYPHEEPRIIIRTDSTDYIVDSHLNVISEHSPDDEIYPVYYYN